MSDTGPVKVIIEPPPIVRRERFTHKGEPMKANLHDAPGIEAEWRIRADVPDNQPTEVLTVVAGKLDVAAADLARVAEIQRGYAQPFLDRASQADRHGELVVSLVEQVVSKTPAVEAEPVDGQGTKVKGTPTVQGG